MKSPRIAGPTLALALLASAAASAGDAGRPMGPLAAHPENPRYFRNSATGEVVYVAGSHVWNNLQDMGPTDPPEPFDFERYLDWMADRNHNSIRLWRWELTAWDTSKTPWKNETTFFHVAPHPWPRTGPGEALDGKPKFDLDAFDPAYFDRLRARVESARRRGIYVSVMLFEGWGVQFEPEGLRRHPFHARNNINGVDGDANKDGSGVEIHELVDPKVRAVQEAYVRKVIETVGDLDNVLYEISNENHAASLDWQYHMIRFIKEVERDRPMRHPVGITFLHEGGRDAMLYDSPADWISPRLADQPSRENPPPADGRKVVLLDTDHLFAIGGTSAWVWKSLARGHNPLFMDPYDGAVLDRRFNPSYDALRRSLGQSRRVAARLDLAAMVPSVEDASTGFALAAPGRSYLVYLPDGGEVTVDLSRGEGPFSVEWFHPGTDRTAPGKPVEGGDRRTLRSPFGEGDAVLLLESGR